MKSAIYHRLGSKRKQNQYQIGDNKKAFLDPEADPLNVLKNLKDNFDKIPLQQKFPAILFQHQLYSFIENRTKCDKKVISLCESGQIKIFKVGENENSTCIVFTKDFVDYVTSITKETDHKNVADKFIEKLIKGQNKNNVSIDELQMKENGFKDKDITELMRCGLLTVRDAGTWWFSIPRMGQFMKLYKKGQQAFLRTVKATMNNEVLLPELLSRNCPKAIVFGMKYHIHDAVGSELVTTYNTSSGIMIKISHDKE